MMRAFAARHGRLVLCLGMLLPIIVSAAPPRTMAVADGIELLPGQLQAGRSPDGNSLLIRGPSGVVVIDTGRGGEHTTRLIELVRSQKQPLAAVINTHWHLDHIGGNARFKAQWPQLHVYAHPSLDDALKGFHANNLRQLQLLLPTLPDNAPSRSRMETERDVLLLGRALAETDAIPQSVERRLGGRNLDIRVAAHAVTEGDLRVFDTQTRTLIAGDLVTLPAPLFDTACPEQWAASLEELARTPFTTLVPGHGPPMTPAQFAQYRKAFDRLLICTAQASEAAPCVDGWLADASSLIDPADTDYTRQLLDYYYDQVLKKGAPGRQRWCAGEDA